MKFEIPPLPYTKDALEPHLSAETLELHYEKHHKGYMEKLRKSIEGKPEAERSLEELIRTTDGDLFNNPAQVWNHTFYWMSLNPDGGGTPERTLLDLRASSFGSFAKFRERFSGAANGEFGSGWAWLVRDATGRLLVRNSSDAENPLQRNQIPLLTLDVWEHAYYVDYRNERARYVETFLDHLLNWDFVASNLALASGVDPGAATASTHRTA
jgi:Fe-Mn family superoxide dismutase